MILDTNALSAWADGTPAIAPLLRSASRLVVPAIALGEFDFGIRQSRHYSRYQAWLAQNLLCVDRPALGSRFSLCSNHVVAHGKDNSNSDNSRTLAALRDKLLPALLSGSLLNSRSLP